MLSSSSSSLSSVSLITVRLSILHISLSLLCFFGTRDASAFAKDDDDDYRVHHDTISSKKPIDCGVYLAPSSIPFSGLGMYVGNRSYEENDIVTDEDIVIPIFEREWHTGHRRGKFMHDEYTWNGNVFPLMDHEVGDFDSVNVASGGVGAAANSYLSLVNVEDNWILLGRGVGPKSPGLGASTIYHGRSFYATAPMQPGQEIFVSYGESYFSGRTKTYGYIPFPSDYVDADYLLEKALDLTLRNPKFAHADDAAGQDDIPLTDQIWHDLHSIIVELSSEQYKESRILNAVPPNAMDVPLILQNGGTAKQHLNRSIKELEWLEENGQCMDNIKVGNSTNPDAGRGAFAKRFIPKGGLVSPSPLIHVADWEKMKVWLDHKYNEKNEIVPDFDGRFTYQLVINYCFAHNRSTLLLCPYGLLTSLINHSSKEPNTKIQWNNAMRHKEWLEKPIKAWGNEYHTGLQVDFVALRDIEEDEEIFIDYGDQWQAAWEKHVAKFVPPPDTYMPAYQMNEWMEQFELRTITDREYELDGVRMYCKWWYLRRRGIRKPKDADDPACRILKQLIDDTYLVELVTWSDSDEKSEFKVGYEQRGRLVWGLPRDALYFQDMPYTRDVHQDWAFRHPMMFPDDIFPEIWRNYEGDDR